MVAYEMVTTRRRYNYSRYVLSIEHACIVTFYIDFSLIHSRSLLKAKLGEFPRSRPLLSLIAYCCYHTEDYARAAEFYETLTELCPESEDYRVYYVQTLVKSGSYFDASRVASSAVMSSTFHSQRLKLLRAHAEMEQGMLSACSTTLSSCLEDDVETIIALATLDFREGRFAKSLETYNIAKQVAGGQPCLDYYISLCHYELGDYDAALELVDRIIEERREDHAGAHDSLQCQENSSKESFFVEALNLKAAVLYTTKHYDAAKNLFARHFNENLDTVTIHNDVVANIDGDPSIGMQKLEFLLAQSFPPETLSNLLTLYTSHSQDDLAAETFERNKHLAKELLTPDVYAYFDAVMMSLSCPDDAFSMLEAQIAQHTPKLRSGKKNIKSALATPATSHRPATSARPTNAAERKEHRALAVATKEFEVILDRFIPALMLQCRIYWDRKEYSRVEQILQQSADFCHENDVWLMNMGHTMFAQQHGKFEASIEKYELLLEHQTKDNLLKVPAVAFANLCVAYIMTNQNEAAETLIKTVEREEQQQAALGINGERAYHTSCIINLVVGTLYCERGNYEFGISRICKSMEPFEENLCLDTWFYAKRCFLALARKIAKMMCITGCDTLEDIICFFDDIESHGKHIIIAESEATHVKPLKPKEPATIASEARQLRSIFIKLCA
ncbi:hypothetical protein ACHAXR_005709 [Thalassiosira sp. AJA248-18]